jgi:hypothetical protein
MAVRLFTGDASSLLSAIRVAIDKGRVDTWSYDSDGDFTHTTHDRQWVGKAYLKPRQLSDRLVLNIIMRCEDDKKRAVYGVFHGRFIEMAVTHFPRSFTTAVATPFMTKEDRALNST